jgi:hypothetical protein
MGAPGEPRMPEAFANWTGDSGELGCTGAPGEPRMPEAFAN